MDHFAATSAKYPAVVKHVMKIFSKTKLLDFRSTDDIFFKFDIN